jgi:hypothetical protein
MTQPKRLITLNARTDAIAERVKRQTKFGFSSWVRARLVAWDDRQKHGFEESREVERLRLERKASEYHRLALTLGNLLSKGDRSWVGVNPSDILRSTFAEQKSRQTSEDVVE